MVLNEKKESTGKHSISMEDRGKFVADGVNEVISFDENTIELDTKQGKLIIKGSLMKIDKLNLSNSELELSGKINSLVYDINFKKNRKSILQSLLK